MGALVYFLRKVPWTVPGFAVDGYRERLASLHELIEREGSFVAHSRRFSLRLARLDSRPAWARISESWFFRARLSRVDAPSLTESVVTVCPNQHIQWGRSASLSRWPQLHFRG